LLGRGIVKLKTDAEIYWSSTMIAIRSAGRAQFILCLVTWGKLLERPLSHHFAAGGAAELEIVQGEATSHVELDGIF
jgi:hypothetical protein